MSTADGPDYWEIRNIPSGDVLNIREKPDWKSQKIGEIPPGAMCIKNLGCTGGLTMQEFIELSEEAKEQMRKKRPRWCKIDYGGTIGWVSGKYLREGTCPAATSGN